MRFDWLSELLARFQDEHLLVLKGSAKALAPAHLIQIDAEDWGRAAQVTARFGCRFSGCWAEESADTTKPGLLVNSALVFQGDCLILRARLAPESAQLPSQTPWFPGANRLERHTMDLFGLVFTKHPDPRRWTRHNRWPTNAFPLRKAFAPDQPPLPAAPETDYAFIQAQGAGTCEVPVGPVHAGIIEPGHFRIQIAGETPLRLEQRLGYVHKGIEKIAEGRDAPGLARLAARISGDSALHHGWAACMAMERAARLSPPTRALHLRAILAERERIANHLGDIGAICNDVAFGFAWQQFARLRELWLRDNASAFGHRLLMDTITPGGLALDPQPKALAQLHQALEPLKKALERLYPILNDHPSLQDRLTNTGILGQTDAQRLGCLGYVGKASGQDIDLRRDHPYPPYDQLRVNSPLFTSGDVEARMQVRMLEILDSLRLLDQLHQSLPGGDIRTEFQPPPAGAEGLGLVEGWRGEILCYIRFGEDGRIARFFPRDPSWFNWPALEILIENNIVPDFPVCNKSVNGSYSAQDL
jgi:Ni,Fe-hydrogenase III large subunit